MASCDPHYVAPLRNRGDLRRTSGDAQGAMQDYNHALELAPKDQTSLLGRGFLRLQAEDNASAVADYDTYITANSKCYGAYFNRGLAREKLGDLKGALEDFLRTLDLSPSMVAAKTNATRLEASLGAAAGGAPAQPAQASVPLKPIATSAPAPVASEGTRVLAPFTGYAVADPCMQAEARPGVPWGADGAPAGGAVEPAELGQYQGMLRHAMEGLRLLYGPLSQKEESSFNAFWAPFFDHPTKAALDYFKQITPLLDDMAVTLSNLDGMLPGMGEALQDTMLAGGDPTSGASRVATAQCQRLKAERARLDDISRKISALGNPPNPLAAKCAAHALHRKAIPNQSAQTDVDASFYNILNIRSEYEKRLT